MKHGSLYDQKQAKKKKTKKTTHKEQNWNNNNNTTKNKKKKPTPSHPEYHCKEIVHVELPQTYRQRPEQLKSLRKGHPEELS